MESIQLAQMLADLSDLNAAEAEAALALVNANKALAAVHRAEPAQVTELQKQGKQARHHQRVGSASAIISRTASPARFDKFGRRILTPPMTRTNSAQGSIPGTSTPKRESESEDDVVRATSLMQLYDIRAKLKQQDNSSLLKARERINAIHARQVPSPISAIETKETEVRQMHFTYPRSS